MGSFTGGGGRAGEERGSGKGQGVARWLRLAIHLKCISHATQPCVAPIALRFSDTIRYNSLVAFRATQVHTIGARATRPAGRKPHRFLKGKTMANGIFSITIADLPAEMQVPVGDTGKTTTLRLKDFAPSVIRSAVINGFIGALNNVSRGKDDETGKPNSDDVWASMRQKRADVWAAGDWAGRGGGGAEAKGLKEAYIAERLQAGSTLAKIEAAMKAQVIAIFGSKPTDDKAPAVPVSFDNFLKAVATAVARKEDARAKPDSEAAMANYEKLVTVWTEKANTLRAQRASAAGDIDLGDMGI